MVKVRGKDRGKGVGGRGAKRDQGRDNGRNNGNTLHLCACGGESREGRRAILTELS